MFSKLNFVLLVAVTLSALYVTDLRMSIKRQTHLYGKGQEEEIRLNQDRAELMYERSKHSDAQQVEQAALQMKMRKPTPEETVALHN
ncbi:cell division protein FtsL [Wielerella bovis]|uniref:cell division protein FtsL n=1 Tax=Wielerella bovis TaxID=2917790 RepID=UPI00201920F2|nr:cell division protein FtsL [Wielerella bovis]MCG7657612.1 cell division protein FtsL [Wielerella bovis]MCG7659833.1 cell division protein FtsL [Wielerella bovis]ULJ59827.1 cell division protein FtsL [Wielerella bovis]ULJ62027.1 cell division protein FtsL [Wielerella bovis]ULJ64254.1 cell division protein FtsL [Wielerella bovis]